MSPISEDLCCAILEHYPQILQNPEALNLLCAPQADVLVVLGMKTSVGPAVLLDAARALDRSPAVDDAARDRAAALLMQLDALACQEAQGVPPPPSHVM